MDRCGTPQESGTYFDTTRVAILFFRFNLVAIFYQLFFNKAKIKKMEFL